MKANPLKSASSSQMVVLGLMLIGVLVVGVGYYYKSANFVVNAAAKSGLSPIPEFIGVYNSPNYAKWRLLDGEHRQFHRGGFFGCEWNFTRFSWLKPNGERSPTFSRFVRTFHWQPLGEEHELIQTNDSCRLVADIDRIEKPIQLLGIQVGGRDGFHWGMSIKNVHPRNDYTPDNQLGSMRQNYGFSGGVRTGFSGVCLYYGKDSNDKSGENQNPIKYHFLNGSLMRICGAVSFFFGWGILWLSTMYCSSWAWAVRKSGQVGGVLIMVIGLASIVLSQQLGN